MNVEREALVVLAERGWCQGNLVSDDGRVCLTGALAVAAEESGAGTCGCAKRTLAVLREQYADRLGDNELSVINFNDHPDTTLADVIAVLEKASLRADEVVT